MNKKSPCFPFYPSDFFGDVKVRVMSPDAKAFYLLLLANIWDYDTQYSIPDDPKLLSKLLEIDEQRVIDLLFEIRPCFFVHQGRLISRRLKREKDKQDKYIKSQSEKGKKSAQQRLNRGSTAVQPEYQPEGNLSIPIPIPIPKPIPKPIPINNTPLTPRKRGKIYSDDFLTFYGAYPRKVGRDAAWRAWKKRNAEMPPLAKILEAVEAQRQSEQWTRDGGQYIPNPATWINQGRWDDELKVELEDEWARLKREALEKDRLEAERRKTQ